MKEIVFVSGVHGVGKGTLCEQLSRELSYDIYSCSDLIKEFSSYIESGKLVSNAERNQIALREAIKCLPEKKILLDGHFCLVSDNNEIVELDYSTFNAISPNKIICVTCAASTVYQRLISRDGSSLSLAVITELQESEFRRSYRYSEENNIPLFKYESGKNTQDLIEWLL